MLRLLLEAKCFCFQHSSSVESSGTIMIRSINDVNLLKRYNVLMWHGTLIVKCSQ